MDAMLMHKLKYITDCLAELYGVRVFTDDVLNWIVFTRLRVLIRVWFLLI